MGWSVNFDDCHGNENVNFEVSHPAFIVDEDGSVVPLRDVTDSGSTLFIHGRTAFADDMVEIKIHGAPERRPQTLKEILGLGQSPAFMRTKRSLLAPPMFVPENQRAPFPKSIGKVISSEMPDNVVFKLTGEGADQEPKGIFYINKNTGEVLVSRSLDRERIAFYHVSTFSIWTREGM
ncbi:Cadherin-13 [Acipenser ruthenus]|uniref:Cadherin-13 n=1 Tax=Acipenser ruthenus TaxID=7906 RepID=A0A662YXD1_ACIRT|nr:Cadherin-13 [Acipenser ruthenus]